MTALLGNGFKVPPGVSRPTALASIHHYDQIALRTQNNLVEIADSGCFRWQDHVFREDDYPAYQPIMPTTTKTGKPARTDLGAYRKWRTWQMSDHLPLWVEIKMDFTKPYLESLRGIGTPLANFDPASGPAPKALAS